MRPWKDYKTVKANETHPWDVIRAIHPEPNKITMGPEYQVISVNPTEVVVFNRWTQKNEVFDGEMEVDVYLSEEELHARDFNEAKEVARAMDHELYDEGDAYHEMWNGWIDTDPYNMASNVKEYKIIIIGWFKLKTVHQRIDLDIGIVAEDETGDRFWCHAYSEWFKYWKEYYPELYEEE